MRGRGSRARRGPPTRPIATPSPARKSCAFLVQRLGARRARRRSGRASGARAGRACA
jgi:hypothetical protein